MKKRSNMRFANGVVSAAIVCFFMVHGLIGVCALVFSFSSPLAWVVWVGVGFVALHVVLSIATSYEQMTDVQFPPSARKKRHLVLKWATGGLLAAAVVAHILCMRSSGSFAPTTTALLTIALVAVLAVHIWVGAKSLLTDVGLSKNLMTPLRVLVCVLAAVFAVMAVVGLSL